MRRNFGNRIAKTLVLVLLALVGSLAQAQNVRWDWTASTTTGVGQMLPVLALPGASISFYTGCTALPCATPAVTYQSASGASCPSNAQVVWQAAVGTGCHATADSEGNFGGWFAPGDYQYTITINSTTAGPYDFAVGSGGGTPIMNLQHNSSATGILQSLYNLCDNGSCGPALDSGMQQVVAKTGTNDGSWVLETASTQQGIAQVFNGLPSTSQHVILYPNSGAASGACGFNTVCSFASGLGAYMEIQRTGGDLGSNHPLITMTGATLPASIPSGNVTGVWVCGTGYAGHLAGEVFTDFGPLAGTPITYGTYCTSQALPFDFATSSWTMHTEWSVSWSGNTGVAYFQPFLFVTYTGTPVPDTSIYFAPPITVNNSVVGLRTGFIAEPVIDVGTANAYHGNTDSVPVLQNGQAIILNTLNANTGASTFDFNGSTQSIVKCGGAALASGDMTSNAPAFLLEQADQKWLLTDPQTGCGGSGGFPITLGSTSIAANSTTTSVSGLTVNGVDLSTSAGANDFLNGSGSYAAPLSLTTTGTSGAATFSGGVLNIPNYSTGTGLPSCTSGQMVYYAANGTTGSCLTVGANLSITSGTLNASGSGGGANLTMNDSGSGAASGTTYNGSVAQTISYNTIGAAPALANCSDESATFTPANGNCYFVTAAVSTATPAASAFVVFRATTSSAGSLALTGTTIADGGSCSSYISGTTLTLPASQTVAVWSDGTNIRATCTAAGSGGGTPAGVSGNPQINASGSFGAQTNVFYAQSGDTITSINSLCSTGATYDVSINLALTLTANTTLNCNVKFEAGGEFSLTGAFTLTMAGQVSGPPTQHFAGSSTVVFGAKTLLDYAEWFGAVGDCSGTTCTTDNHVAMQAAINALGPGTMLQLLAKGYGLGTTCDLTVTASNVGIVGAVPGHTGTLANNPSYLVCGSASATILDIGDTATVQYDIFRDFAVERSVAPGNPSIGINAVNSKGMTMERVQSHDSFWDFYFTGTPSYGTGVIRNVEAAWGYAGSCMASGGPVGFYVDGSVSALDSMRGEKWTIANNCGSVITPVGLYLKNATDFSLSLLEGGDLYYGVETSGTGNDITLRELRLDGLYCSALLASGFSGALNVGGDGYLNGRGGNACHAIDIESSHNVTIGPGTQINFDFGSGEVYLNSSSANAILGLNIFGGCGAGGCIALNASSSNTVTGNIIDASAGYGIILTGSSYNTVNGNICNAVGTGGGFSCLSADAASNHNHYLSNNSSASGTTLLSDLGTDNQPAAQVYPGAGVPVSTGSAWGTSLTEYGSQAGTPTSSDPGTIAGIPMQSDGAHGIQPSSGTFTSGDFCTFTTATGLSCNNGGSGGITIQNGGTPLGTATTMNFSTGTAVSLASGVATVTSSGGSGGFAYSPLPAPPVLTSWTNINFQTGTTLVANGNPNTLFMQILNKSALNWQFAEYNGSLPATPWMVEADLSCFENTGTTGYVSSGDCGVYLYDGTKLEGAEFLYQTGVSGNYRIEQMTNVTTDNTTKFGPSSLEQMADGNSAGKFVGFCYDGANIYNEISMDGQNWWHFYEDTSGFITPTSVGFGGVMVTATASYEMVSLKGFNLVHVSSCP